MLRILGVQPLDRFRVRITLTDGSVLDRNLANLLVGPIFDSLRTHPSACRSVCTGAVTCPLVDG